AFPFKGISGCCSTGLSSCFLASGSFPVRTWDMNGSTGSCCWTGGCCSCFTSSAGSVGAISSARADSDIGWLVGVSSLVAVRNVVALLLAGSGWDEGLVDQFQNPRELVHLTTVLNHSMWLCRSGPWRILPKVH